MPKYIDGAFIGAFITTIAGLAMFNVKYVEANHAKHNQKIQAQYKKQTKRIFNVYATREGLIGKTTASGHVIKKEDIFVALPSRKALHKHVRVTYKSKSIICPVLDVGPWSTHDDYWNYSGRPLSEIGIQLPKRKRKVKNKAGIDLSDGLWDYFGIDRKTGIIKVSWHFEQ